MYSDTVGFLSFEKRIIARGEITLCKAVDVCAAEVWAWLLLPSRSSSCQQLH